MLNLIERNFVVPVTIDIAWDHLAKIEKWRTWAKHIKKIEHETEPPLGIHSKGVIYLQNGIKSTFSMTEFNAYHNWKWVGSFLWLTIHYDHRFRSLDNGTCEMTFHVAAEGFAVNMIGRLFAKIYNGNLDRAIPNLIQEYETIGKN